jgi:tetratricopeptide (TPR) repeat protein
MLLSHCRGFVIGAAFLFTASVSYASEIYQAYQEASLSGTEMTSTQRLEWAGRLESAASVEADHEMAFRMRDEAGALYGSVGERDQAYQVYEAMLADAERVGHYDARVIALGNLANLTFTSSGAGRETLAAYAALEEALRQAPPGESSHQDQLLNVYVRLTEINQAAANAPDVTPDERNAYLDQSIRYAKLYVDNAPDTESSNIATIRYDMAQAYLARGDFGRAADILMELYDSGTSSMVPSQLFMEALKARHGVDSSAFREELVKYLKDATADDSTPMLMDTLARSLAKSGDYAGAAALYEKLVDYETNLLGPREARLVALAAALQADGQFERAKQLYEEILRIAPESPYASNARQGLADLALKMNPPAAPSETTAQEQPVMPKQEVAPPPKAVPAAPVVSHSTPVSKPPAQPSPAAAPAVASFDNGFRWTVLLRAGGYAIVFAFLGFYVWRRCRRR